MTNELANNWVLWYHHINDDNWSEESYMKVCELKTLEDYWKLNNTIPTFTAGIFFLMKENILPRWEDIENIEGGYWSFKISKIEADRIWNIFIMKAIGLTLTNNIEDMKEINGITISPKINNCIIKIWNKNKKNNNIQIINNEHLVGITLSDVIYGSHVA